MDKEKLNEKILSYKKANNLNNLIIIILLAIFLFVCIMAVYVRCFS